MSVEIDKVKITVEGPAPLAGSLSEIKSTLASFLLKYDLNGNLKSKYYLANFYDPFIYGIHNKKIYLNGFDNDVHSNLKDKSDVVSVTRINYDVPKFTVYTLK